MIRRNSATACGALAVLAMVAAAMAVLGSPQWHIYRTRRHIADALRQVDAAKLAVMETATIKGGLAHVRASEVQYSARLVRKEYISRVEITDGGVITMMTRNTGASTDPVIVLIPEEDFSTYGDVEWNCQVFLGDVSLAPASCQNHAPAPFKALSAAAKQAWITSGH